MLGVPGKNIVFVFRGILFLDTYCCWKYYITQLYLVLLYDRVDFLVMDVHPSMFINHASNSINAARICLYLCILFMQ
jgi:hypothetical protein